MPRDEKELVKLAALIRRPFLIDELAPFSVASLDQNIVIADQRSRQVQLRRGIGRERACPLLGWIVIFLDKTLRRVVPARLMDRQSPELS